MWLSKKFENLLFRIYFGILIVIPASAFAEALAEAKGRNLMIS